MTAVCLQHSSDAPVTQRDGQTEFA